MGYITPPPPQSQRFVQKLHIANTEKSVRGLRIVVAERSYRGPSKAVPLGDVVLVVVEYSSWKDRVQGVVVVYDVRCIRSSPANDATPRHVSFVPYALRQLCWGEAQKVLDWQYSYHLVWSQYDLLALTCTSINAW